MGRISDSDRARNEDAVRVAMDRMLREELPPGGKCDLKTLALESGVTRTGFYPKKNRDATTRPGPYQHLAEEFERRRAALRDSGAVPDPRATQIQRLKEANAALRTRLDQRDAELETLKEFEHRAVSRISAQYLEIERLREALPAQSNIRALPRTPNATAPYGSRS
ncbi:hypothetical protein ABZX69_35915 [Streptomyces sp. NPDC004074]|uniref:hypothetical protein n=1 Tax=Streptomyces sp. NPDC004074 TaxID=3154277 RepID=UPI0033B72D97